ncbi:hypothetical protein SUGI_0061070 [Cryptomeria japonica]|nr:hypothetical protein SUGI_0061070 [Cryptomeria japonica]
MTPLMPHAMPSYATGLLPTISGIIDVGVGIRIEAARSLSLFLSPSQQFNQYDIQILKDSNSSIPLCSNPSSSGAENGKDVKEVNQWGRAAGQWGRGWAGPL